MQCLRYSYCKRHGWMGFMWYFITFFIVPKCNYKDHYRKDILWLTKNRNINYHLNNRRNINRNSYKLFNIKNHSCFEFFTILKLDIMTYFYKLFRTKDISALSLYVFLRYFQDKYSLLEDREKERMRIKAGPKKRLNVNQHSMYKSYKSHHKLIENAHIDTKRSE